jgi:ABC-2 type transport system permease protein
MTAAPQTTAPKQASDVSPFAALRHAAMAGAAQNISQPSRMIGFALFFILPPIILASVWKAAAQSSGGDIVGYDATALVWYIAISETAILTVRNRLIEEIGDDIGSGRFAVELQRPTSALSIRLATELGYMAPRFGLGFCLAAIIGLLLGGLPPALLGLALAVPALIVALTINVVGQHLFAAASFWLREAKGAWFLYNKLVFVLGGMLLPLEVLPGWMETVAKALPFMAMAYVPARLAAGFVEPELFAIQFLWLAVALAATAAAFRRGEHRFLSQP